MQAKILKTKFIILLFMFLLITMASAEIVWKTVDDSVLVEITACKDGEVLYDTEPVQLKELEKLIRKDLEEIPSVVFYVKRWKETPQATFLNVLEQLKLAGAKKISVSVKL